MDLKSAWNWWWGDVKHPMGLIFFVYALIAGSVFGYATALLHFFVGAIVGGIVDLFVDRYRNGAWGFPSSGLVTGSIVGLVTAYQTPLWLVAVIALIGVVSKVVVQWKGRHFFNPANFGMLVGIYLLGAHTSWWAALAGPVSTLAIILGGLFVVFRMRRWWIVIPFLLVYFGLRTVAGAVAGDISSILVELAAGGAVFFFTSIMLIEPRTSPSRRIPQLCYGILAAALAFGLSFIPQSGDFHLALALANLSVPVWNRIFK